MTPHQKIEKTTNFKNKDHDPEYMYGKVDIQRMLDNLSREISRLEQENTSLKSTIEKLIPEGKSDQTDGKALNRSRGITTDKQMKQLLHENLQLKKAFDI